MSYRTRKQSPAPDFRQEGVEEAWLSWIEGTYGVMLSDGQLYADNRGLVYAGSEYVARLSKVGGSWQLDPATAHSWSEQISHFPRGTHRLDVASRTAREVPTPELAQGDVVLAHGMRLLIDGEPQLSTSHPGNSTYYYRALILNRDEVLAAGLIPASWIQDNRWTVQGNELARWSVQNGTCRTCGRACGSLTEPKPCCQ